MEKTPAKNTQSSLSWLTRPMYNIMIVSLVLLFSFEKYFDGTVNNVLRGCMFVALAIVVIANVIAIVEFLRRPKGAAANAEAAVHAEAEPE